MQIIALPQASSETADQWFDASWNTLLEEFGGRPETIQQLRSLGRHREKHTTTSPPGTKTSESNIRDGIKERLRTAFSEVLRQTNS